VKDMALSEKPSIEYLRECLDVDYETGTLYWKVRPESHFSSERGMKIFNTRFSGKPAGTKNSCYGYYSVLFRTRRVQSHIIIFAMKNCRYPEGQLDHINGVRDDNRLQNLREVDNSENHRNMKLFRTSTSGCPGVSWDKKNKKWKVQIRTKEKWIHLGRYQKIEDAICARISANRDYGFHENHGRCA
jgi:hypothetical protein